MSVTYTTNMALGKPTVLDSVNVWGTELNTIFDKLDKAIMSNNFAENSASHSGLNFYYLNGRLMDGITLREISGNFVTLTDDTTNYVEVSTAGTVSANTTSFTAGSIPLFTVITSSGSISTVNDKRSYMTASYNSLFTLNSSVVETDYNFLVGTGTKKDWATTFEYIQLSGNSSLAFTKTAGANSELYITNNGYYDTTDSRWEYISEDEASRIILEDGKIKLQTAVSGVADDPITFIDVMMMDSTNNVFINGASKPTDSVGALHIKQGTDPTSSSADQISFFATAGANSTLGIRTEETVAVDVDETQFSHKHRININGTEYYLMLISV